jgi:two-component system chemotaxis response regulator CheB
MIWSGPSTAPPWRVLIVEDSAFYRAQLARVISADPSFLVVGQASNGREAVELAQTLRPALVTMDVDMPLMGGIEAVREIMRIAPTKIVMLSTYTHSGAETTLDALDAGAVDFIPKRALQHGGDGVSASALRDRLRAILGEAVPASAALAPRAAVRMPEAPPLQTASSGNSIPDFRDYSLLVIGASTGGPALLGELMGAFPADFPAAVLIAVHMPEPFIACFVERLGRRSRLPVVQAVHGAPLQPGTVALAPGGMQTRVTRANGKICLDVQRALPEEIYKPSIDITLASVAAQVGKDALAIILTGMGSDGCEGARALVASGGKVWAQDEASSAVFGMPAAVIRAGLASDVLSPTELANRFRRSR